MHRKSLLLVSACFGALAAPQLAHAQEADRSSTVEEVVVTATLRAENLQEIPLAVTAVSGAQLEQAGVNDVRTLTQVSSSFQVNNSQTESGGTTIRIRGVGTTGNNTGLESAVGIFLDGVYLSRPGIALGELLDVEAIELLRGPQGTLYGRNTSSGALNIKTRRPNLTESDGFANFTAGNYDLTAIQAGFSAPLVQDALAFRLAGAYRKRDGWLRNIAGGDSNDQNRYLVRGQLLWQIAPEIDLRVIADVSKSDEQCCDAVIIRESSYATNGLYAVSGLPANGGVSVSGPGAVEDRRSANNRTFKDSIAQNGISAELNWSIGGGQLTWISGYRRSRAEAAQESDFVAANAYSTSVGTSTSAFGAPESFTRIVTITHEARYAGSTDRWDYLFGAYYATEEIKEMQSLSLGPDFQAYISAALTSVGVPGPNPARNIFAGGVDAAGSYAANLFTQDGRNWSVFTNNTFHITDQLGFNFGLRYSADRKEGAFDQLAANSPACAAVIARTPLLPASLQPLAPLARALTCFPFATAVGLGPQEFNRVFEDEQLVYTAKVTYELNDDINTYVSFSHGYKAGGFNLDPTAALGGADPRFKSETVDAYELGVKSQLFDRRLTANLAVFHQDLEDFQVLEFTGVQFQTFNVPKAQSTGFELELSGRLTEALSANAAVTYADAKYPSDCGGPAPSATVALLCGNSLTNAPEWVIVGGFNYEREILNDLEFGFNVQARYESDRRTSTQALTPVAAGTGTRGPNLNLILSPNDIQEANTKVNLRVSLGSTDDRWRLEFWGNNITDEQTRSVTANTPLRGVASLPGPLNAGGISLSRVAFLQEPRTYGVTLRTRF